MRNVPVRHVSTICILRRCETPHQSCPRISQWHWSLFFLRTKRACGRYSVYSVHIVKKSAYVVLRYDDAISQKHDVSSRPIASAIYVNSWVEGSLFWHFWKQYNSRTKQKIATSYIVKSESALDIWSGNYTVVARGSWLAWKSTSANTAGFPAGFLGTVKAKSP